MRLKIPTNMQNGKILLNTNHIVYIDINFVLKNYCLRKLRKISSNPSKQFKLTDKFQENKLILK